MAFAELPAGTKKALRKERMEMGLVLIQVFKPKYTPKCNFPDGMIMNLNLFLDEQECIWDSYSVLREDTSFSSATTKGQGFNPDIRMGTAN